MHFTGRLGAQSDIMKFWRRKKRRKVKHPTIKFYIDQEEYIYDYVKGLERAGWKPKSIFKRMREMRDYYLGSCDKIGNKISINLEAYLVHCHTEDDIIKRICYVIEHEALHYVFFHRIGIDNTNAHHAMIYFIDMLCGREKRLCKHCVDIYRKRLVER